MFDTLVESGREGLGGKRWYTAPISLLIHGLLVGGIILFPILFPNIVEREVDVIIVAPPAPPPPPQAAAPQQIAQPKAAAPEIDLTPQIVDDSMEVPEEIAKTGAGIGVLGGQMGGDMFGGGGGSFLNEVLPEAAAQPDIPPPRVVTADMERPELVDRVSPVYPSLALKAGVEGTVVLKLIIGLTGKVESAQVLTVVPAKARGIGLEDAAVQAVLKWKFTPAKAGGKPVRVYYNAPVKFKLN